MPDVISQRRSSNLFTALFAAALILFSGCGRESRDSGHGTGNDPCCPPPPGANPAQAPAAAVPEIPAPVLSGEAPVLEAAHPVLASGALRHARLADLDPGYLLHAEGLVITAEDLNSQIATMPPEMQEQMHKNAFFMLEQQATYKLLLHMAHKQFGSAVGADEALQLYMHGIAGSAAVSREEVETFYDQNREMVGDAALALVESQIHQHLLQEKQQRLINEHIANLGNALTIAISAPWAAQQAELAVDNPIDQARASGKPTMASFGADTCRPCQMMKPFRAEIAEKHGERLNVVYVHVNKDQMLASRYGVQSIPFTVFFDADGKLVHEQAGLMTVEQIQAHLDQLGLQL